MRAGDSSSPSCNVTVKSGVAACRSHTVRVFLATGLSSPLREGGSVKYLRAMPAQGNLPPTRGDSRVGRIMRCYRPVSRGQRAAPDKRRSANPDIVSQVTEQLSRETCY